MTILHCIDSSEAAALLAQLSAHAAPAGLEHRALERSALPASWRDPLRIAGLRAALDHEGADVVQTHGFYSALAASFAVSDRPVVHTLHVPFHRLPWLERRGWRWLLERGATAVATSSVVRRSFIFGGGARARAIETIALGLEPLADVETQRAWLAETLGAAPASVLVGAPEQLCARAGHRFLLDAWAALPAALRERARLVLHPEGPLRAELEVGAPERTSFAPGALADHLPVCDVVVWSSLYGDFPLAAARAMAAGRALVTTAPGGIAEQVERGVEALVVPSQNVPALAAALAAVLEDEALRARLGRAAHELFERRLSSARMAAGWAEVYERITRRARG